VALRVETGWKTEIVRRVTARDLDLGLAVLTVPGPDLPPQLTCVPLQEAEVVFVAPASDPFVKRRRLTIDDLRDVPWVLNLDGCQYRGYLERCFAERGLAMNVAVEVAGLEVQKRLAQLGLGVTLLPRPFVAQELKAGTLKAFTVEGATLRSLTCLIYRRDKYIHGAMQGFFALLREVFPPGKASQQGRGVDSWKRVTGPASDATRR
jgi:DNA-binding transcriptional LysR family regulator